MTKFEIFRSSQVTTDCDQCHGRVDLLKGGVCPRCNRILCYRHLHGSWWRRLVADLGAPLLCARCRSGRVSAGLRETNDAVVPIERTD